MMRRMFVAEPEPDEIYYFVNPEIISMTGTQESEEGCLSVPGYSGLVDRPEKIRIKGLGRDGEPQEYEFEGFRACLLYTSFSMGEPFTRLNICSFIPNIPRLHTCFTESSIISRVSPGSPRIR